MTKFKKWLSLLLIMLVVKSIVSCYSKEHVDDISAIRNAEATKGAKAKNDESIHKMRAQRFEKEGHSMSANDEKQWAREASKESNTRDSSVKNLDNTIKSIESPIPYICCD